MWLKATKQDYAAYADALGVARGTVAQWFRETAPTPMPLLARRATGMLMERDQPREASLSYDELRHLELWSRREGIGVVELIVRIVRERLAKEA